MCHKVQTLQSLSKRNQQMIIKIKNMPNIKLRKSTNTNLSCLAAWKSTQALFNQYLVVPPPHTRLHLLPLQWPPGTAGILTPSHSC